MTSNREVDDQEFIIQGGIWSTSFKVMATTWIDSKRRIRVCFTQRAVRAAKARSGDQLKLDETEGTMICSRSALTCSLVRIRPKEDSGPYNTPTLQLQVPLIRVSLWGHHGEYSRIGLLRFGVPTEVAAKYPLPLLDDKDEVLAGSQAPLQIRRPDLHAMVRRTAGV
jgi:hypothetical protein